MAIHGELVARTILIIVFVFAVFGKARSYDAFVGFTQSLAPLVKRKNMIVPVASLVVAAEIAALVLLLRGRWQGHLLAAALLVVLTCGVAASLHRNLPMTCRCFGKNGELRWHHLVRNGVLLIAAVLGCFARFSAQPEGIGQAAGLDVAAGLVIGLAITRWDELAFLIAPSSRRTPAASGRRPT